MVVTKEIIIVGYPRSGNTWLSRLIADALDSPLIGLDDRAVPIGQEGQDRPGSYIVRQLHLEPCFEDRGELIPDTRRFVVSRWDRSRTKVILMMRDPRDVCVSAMYYWELPTVRAAIDAMQPGQWPIAVPLSWGDFNLKWMDQLVTVMRYESLLADTCRQLEWLMDAIGLPVNNPSDVVERQSIQVRRKGFEVIKGGYHPYGTGIQLKHLRKGIAGDWRNHFTRADGDLFHGLFFHSMRLLGYERNRGWWQSLPETN